MGMTKLVKNIKQNRTRMKAITDAASARMIDLSRITTDTMNRSFTHITVTIRPTTPTIPTTLTIPTTGIMDTGILIGMVGGVIAIIPPATTRTGTFIMASDAH